MPGECDLNGGECLSARRAVNEPPAQQDLDVTLPLLKQLGAQSKSAPQVYRRTYSRPPDAAYAAQALVARGREP
jgi:hypothetical protein